MFFTLINVIYSMFFAANCLSYFFFKIRTSHTAILFFLTEPRVSTLRVQKHCVIYFMEIYTALTSFVQFG